MVVRMRDVLAIQGRCYGVFTLLKVEFSHLKQLSLLAESGNYTIDPDEET